MCLYQFFVSVTWLFFACLFIVFSWPVHLLSQGFKFARFGHVEWQVNLNDESWMSCGTKWSHQIKLHASTHQVFLGTCSKEEILVPLSRGVSHESHGYLLHLHRTLQWCINNLFFLLLSSLFQNIAQQLMTLDAWRANQTIFKLLVKWNIASILQNCHWTAATLCDASTDWI